MKYLLPLIIFFSIEVSAQSQECLNLLEEELSLQETMERMVKMKDSWICLNQYQSQTAPVQNLHYQEKEEPSEAAPNSIFFNRIRFIVDQYAEKGFNIDFTLPLPMLHNYSLENTAPVILNQAVSYQEESFHRFTPSVFEGFSSEMRRHLSMLRFRNRYYTLPVSIFTTENISKHGFSDFMSAPRPYDMNSVTRIIELPPFLLCKKPLPQNSSQFTDLYLQQRAETLKFIQSSPEALELYLSVLDFYNISQGRTPHSLPLPQHVMHSLPYGFGFSSVHEPILQNLTENGIAELSELIQKLKKYTFAKSILNRSLNCLPSTFQETLSISYIQPAPSIDGADSEQIQTNLEEAAASEELSFSFQYRFNEYLLRSKGVFFPPKLKSFDYAWIHPDDSLQNDFLRDKVPEFFGIEQPLLKILSGNEE